MSIYLFEEGYFKSDFGRGAAISILMLLIVAVLSVVYVRKMVRIGEVAVTARRRKGRRARQTGWNIVGIAVFVVMVFPVFWMISTAFKSNDQIVSLTPTWFPLHPTLQHFRDAINRPFFWAGRQEQPDRRLGDGRALDRARVPGRDRARALPVRRAASSSSCS